MKYILTSSPCLPDRLALNPANGLDAVLGDAQAEARTALFICSDPDSHEKTDAFSGDMRECLADAGFHFADWRTLDGRNEARAAALVRWADFIVLAGGHVPTQNRFFRHIGLRSLLAHFDGALMGISAGTMNCAETVYAQPEIEGEAVDPAYRRFLPGLGVTRTCVLPHYQLNRFDVLDGLRVYEDIAYPDSVGHCFYALPDGSFIWGDDAGEYLRGEAWRIRDGKIEKVCENGEALRLR